jgi:hypothetical protein
VAGEIDLGITALHSLYVGGGHGEELSPLRNTSSKRSNSSSMSHMKRDRSVLCASTRIFARMVARKKQQHHPFGQILVSRLMGEVSRKRFVFARLPSEVAPTFAERTNRRLRGTPGEELLRSFSTVRFSFGLVPARPIQVLVPGSPDALVVAFQVFHKSLAEVRRLFTAQHVNLGFNRGVELPDPQRLLL